VWREHLFGDDPAEERIPRALDAWAGYIERHPYAPRMFLFESTGDPQAKAIHEQVTGLAIWWSDHPHVPRERVVATAVNVLWIGFERVRRGETWAP
jgi:hypothetical protein